MGACRHMVTEPTGDRLSDNPFATPFHCIDLVIGDRASNAHSDIFVPGPVTTIEHDCTERRLTGVESVA